MLADLGGAASRAGRPVGLASDLVPSALALVGLTTIDALTGPFASIGLAVAMLAVVSVLERRGRVGRCGLVAAVSQEGGSRTGSALSPSSMTAEARTSSAL